MKDLNISPIKKFNKEICTASDKSITHRALMFNAFSEGSATILNALMGEDCLSTAACMKSLGAQIDINGSKITVKGAERFNSANLDVGNSGTTIRLLSGLLAGKSGKFVLSGDSSILKRPMNRVIKPISQMGADIVSNGGFAPLEINGATLKGISYRMPVASAQVKSAILLAGLFADGATTVIEDIVSRDHTERMLKALGANINCEQVSCEQCGQEQVGCGNICTSKLSKGGHELCRAVTVKKSKLVAKDFVIPGDISSAAFPLMLAACLKDSSVKIKNVGVNNTRTGILDVLKMCGADFELTDITDDFEPCADITLNYTMLKPFKIDREIMPRLIDEIPILAVLACFINGTSQICGAEELKVKESNRIDTIYDMLTAFGANVCKTDDGLIIHGEGGLKGGAAIDPKGDHRIAMSAAVAAACSKDGGKIFNPECAYVSYPNFYKEVIGNDL